MRIEVIGVYLVAAPEPCHLVEIRVSDGDPADAIESITQEIPGRPRDEWQVPYDEHYLAADATIPELPDSATAPHIAFFFHYLDLRRPLLTAAGPVQLPFPAPRPPHLAFMHYEPPC